MSRKKTTKKARVERPLAENRGPVTVVQGPVSSMRGLWLLAVLAVVTLAYANHFTNTFHFDDAHTIVFNPYIRDLGNLPRFFTDGDTFSTLPPNRSWRPLISASLAIDYRLGGGLKPIAFQMSTFFWFLVQLVVVYLLFLRTCDLVQPGEGNAGRNFRIALFATALYGLHPAIAETVNYVIQRAEVYSTLGVVGGLVLYIYFPGWRRYGLYLIPAAIAVLCKPPALIFPALLFVWIWLFEDEKPSRALARCIPSIVVAGALAALTSVMTPKTFSTGTSPGDGPPYVFTQPLVALRYFLSFFTPTHLSADTDFKAIRNPLDPAAWVGILFVIGVIWGAWRCSRERQLRPIAFGLYWYLIALFPTSILALAEVENDHRMFFPFVGLAFSVVWAASIAVRQWAVPRAAIAAVCGLVLAACAWGTWQRNEIWRTDESLWRDVTIKSPSNGRGLMNYGLALMARGDYPGAIDYYQRAHVYRPDYFALETNMGIAYGKVGNDAEAERHFLRAIELKPTEADPQYHYASWLRGKGRFYEAAAHLDTAVTNNPADTDAWHLLMQTAADLGDGVRLRTTAQNMLAQFPNDETARNWLRNGDALTASPESFLDRSLTLFQQGRYEDSIAMARMALKLRPNYAEAWNNVGAAYNAMKRWDEAIQAEKQALAIKPDYELAKNNLAVAESKKR